MDEYDWADQERLVRQDVEEIERNMNELTVVVKQNPGSIEINFDELEQRLDEKLAEYDGIIFTAETKDIGKKEAASLRNLKKDIDATRKAVKKKWMEPYDEFDTQMKALGAKVDKPISAIDGQLKAFEEKRNGAPSDWAGIMLVSTIYINGEVNGYLKVAWDMSMTQYIMKNNKDGSVAHSWKQL